MAGEQAAPADSSYEGVLSRFVDKVAPDTAEPEKPETPAEQTPQPPVEAETPPQPEGETPEQPSEPADDSEEVEYEGSLYRVPKELKEAVIRHADYTRKTQEVAQLRNMAAAERQGVQEAQLLDAEVAEERMQVAGVGRVRSRLTRSWIGRAFQLTRSFATKCNWINYPRRRPR